jgi:hypothetical protein
MWDSLPAQIQYELPFIILLDAGDPLSWGGEKGSKELCEKMFC